MALVVIVVGLVAWVGVRAGLARAELEAAIPLAGDMQRQVVAGEGDAARLTGEKLTERAASAAVLTSDPVWRAFEVVPALGPNLAVVRQLAGAINDLAQDGIAPLAQVAGQISVDDFRPVDGTVDVQPLLAAQPAVSQALTAMRTAQTQVAEIDGDGTIDQVAEAVVRLSTAVNAAEPALDAVDKAVRVVPNMLGASGPRNYLVLVQNPAELRSTGGIMGAVALVHTEAGSIQLTQQASGASFPRHPESVLELPTDTRNLYGAITGQYMLNVGLTPRFPLSAALAKEMWRLQYGLEVDGVLSIDPVALSYILAATGPIALPSGDSLTSDNAVSLLLTDVYQRFEAPKEQDDFFAAAAASVFSAVAGGDADPVALIEALAKAGAEHRVLVWSAADAEQAVLDNTTLAGGLPASDADTERFGLYLNDATGAKMDTYLDVSTSVGQVTCRNDKRPNFGVEVTLTNTAHSDAGKALPKYVTGGTQFGVSPGNVKTIVSGYASPEVQNLGLTRDGQAAPYLPASDEGFQVSALTVELAPGQSTVIRYNWLGTAPFDGDLELQMTPVIHRNETKKLDMTC
ncbi:DUF4012 domain-containing protein [Cryobacterium arcticum]|uniref:DUF4012 domain-containing protein n=1 Tax=Cryobacterium arcticum TaxID=670052 RepID=UPI0014315764|nr:DUF4012 domain-containing protein [Cryobacterium arcticum]